MKGNVMNDLIDIFFGTHEQTSIVNSVKQIIYQKKKNK